MSGKANGDRSVESSGPPLRRDHQRESPSRSHVVLQLQRTAGNHAVGAYLAVQRGKKGGKKGSAELDDLDALLASIEGPTKKAKPKAPAAKKKSAGQKAAEKEVRDRAARKAVEEEAARAAAAVRAQERIAEVKATFEKEKPPIVAGVAAARGVAATWTIDLSTLDALEAKEARLAAATTPNWDTALAALRALSQEAARIAEVARQKVEQARLAVLAAAGRLGRNNNEIDTQELDSVAGDGHEDELASVKEAVEALKTPAANPWRGGGGKWGDFHGNGEGNLPVASYREYYVRPPDGEAAPGARRLVQNTANKRIYYSWTHYGQSGKPPFVLLT